MPNNIEGIIHLRFANRSTSAPPTISIGYPSKRRAFRWISKQALRATVCLVFTADCCIFRRRRLIVNRVIGLFKWILHLFSSFFNVQKLELQKCRSLFWASSVGSEFSVHHPCRPSGRCQIRNEKIVFSRWSKAQFHDDSDRTVAILRLIRLFRHRWFPYDGVRFGSRIWWRFDAFELWFVCTYFDVRGFSTFFPGNDCFRLNFYF